MRFAASSSLVPIMPKTLFEASLEIGPEMALAQSEATREGRKTNSGYGVGIRFIVVGSIYIRIY
jgi:hypothetical protein